MTEPLKLKVCGMAQKQNIIDLLALKPEFVGFIFYEKSLRNVLDKLDEDVLNNFPKNIFKVGVFVDGSKDFIVQQHQKYNLDYIQLHGNESPKFCSQIKELDLKIIKAFSVNEQFDFVLLSEYEQYCDYFLFDTKGQSAGGNGIKFDWNILLNNHINKPFFLSGGIDLSDIVPIKRLRLELNNLIALDVNSKFEMAPALKNISQIALLQQALSKQE